MYTTTKAARLVGVHIATLQRWIADGKVRAPKLVIRRGRAVRLWTGADLKHLRKRKAAIYRKGRGRKPKGEKG